MRFHLALAASGALALLAATRLPAPAQEPTTRLYHDDPDHPWNRVHVALFRRDAPLDRTIGIDAPDPLLWPGSDHLLADDRFVEALAAVEALAEDGGGVEDPLKRAILQNDLWTFFDWAVTEIVETDLDTSARWELARRLREAGGPALDYRGVEELPEEDWSPIRAEIRAGRELDRTRKRSLARAIARALRRLTLSTEEIDALADNYADAVEAGSLPPDHDPTDPRAAFLPPGLLNPEGAWVELGDAGSFESLAPQHAEIFGGRSSFTVHLRVPGGRDETLRYLASLRSRGSPTVPCERPGCGLPRLDDERHAHLDPDAAALPAGSVVALVRRMLVIDDDGDLQVTPIVKSAQMRAFLEVPEDFDPTVRTFERPEAWPWQAVAELSLDRARLFAGEAGGLVAVGRDEHRFHFVGAHGDGVDLLPDDYDVARGGRAHLATCASCHGTVGIHSVNSYTRIASGPGTHYLIPLRLPPRLLIEGGPGIAALQAVELKRRRYDWGALRSLWGD